MIKYLIFIFIIYIFTKLILISIIRSLVLIILIKLFYQQWSKKILIILNYSPNINYHINLIKHKENAQSSS